jgi:large subunit ribosomal protein L18
VYRSLHHISAQIIDDPTGRTLVAASSSEADLRKAQKSTANLKAAEAVGKAVAERAQKAGIKLVVFDRGGYLYHGRVKALAEAARGAGLEF